MPPGMEGFGSDAKVRDTSGEDWPFAMGNVIGYRWWTYQVHRNYCLRAAHETHPCICGLDGPALRGSFDGVWASSVFWAQCGQSYCKRVLDHPELCGCGVWAYWKLPFSRKASTGYSYPVAGRIEGSGRVVIGEKGFRCERARITHLAVYPDTPETVVRALERTFELSGGVLVGGVAKFGVNPVSRVLSRKTKADPQYGPPPMSARKVVRIITGF